MGNRRRLRFCSVALFVYICRMDAHRHKTAEMTQADGSPDASGSVAWFGKVLEIVSEEGVLVEFIPQGYSMWPALRPGRDTVLLKRAAAYRRGDIVLARCDAPHDVVLHRIVSVEDGRAVLMGDSNLFQTETCLLGAIAGKVTAISRDGRDITRSASTRLLGAVQRLPATLRRAVVRTLNTVRKWCTKI